MEEEGSGGRRKWRKKEEEENTKERNNGPNETAVTSWRGHTQNSNLPRMGQVLRLINVGVDRGEQHTGSSDEVTDVLPRFRGSVTARARAGSLRGEIPRVERTKSIDNSTDCIDASTYRAACGGGKVTPDGEAHEGGHISILFQLIRNEKEKNGHGS